jgi:hypothetical protein
MFSLPAREIGETKEASTLYSVIILILIMIMEISREKYPLAVQSNNRLRKLI